MFFSNITHIQPDQGNLTISLQPYIAGHLQLKDTVILCFHLNANVVYCLSINQLRPALLEYIDIFLFQ